MVKKDSGTGRFVKSRSVHDRFWDKVSIAGPDDCWEWKAGKDNCGYGMFWMDGRTLHATRSLWILMHGSVPDGMCICHRCDNPGCCNPRHLWLGTNEDNSKDRHRKGRSRSGRTNKAKGSAHHHSKLTEADVREMRKLYRFNDKTGLVHKIAERFGVTPGTVWYICNNRGWRHIK